MSVRIFEGSKHANIYARFRPTVATNVIKEVFNFLKEKIPSNDWDIAVDVGCGSGQGTNQLSKYFRKCYGFDVSQAQINEAKESKHCDNVYYEVSPAESLPKVDTNSVQLLTAFEAAHWFELQEFFKESNRILVDNGVVALIGYMIPEPIDPSNPEDESLKTLINDLYFDSRLAPFKNPKIVSIEKHYKDLKFPQNYEYILKDNISDPIRDTADFYIGYVQSWSLYQGLVDKDKPSAEKLIQEFKQKLKEILKTNDLSKKEIIINFTYFIAMGRKSNNNNN